MKLVFVALSVFLLAGCQAAPTPCSTPGTCPRGRECIANRCMPLGSSPVSARTERIVLEPTAVRVLSDGRDGSLPVAVVFGNESVGDSTLYLQFPRASAAPGSLEAAFLLLEPAPGTVHSDVSVDLRAYRISERWQPSRISQVDSPALGPPSARASARGAALHLDVTPIVRHAVDHPQQDHGLAVVAGARNGHGVSFSTGLQAGLGPRLELYVKPR